MFMLIAWTERLRCKLISGDRLGVRILLFCFALR